MGGDVRARERAPSKNGRELFGSQLARRGRVRRSADRVGSSPLRLPGDVVYCATRQVWGLRRCSRLEENKRKRMGRRAVDSTFSQLTALTTIGSIDTCFLGGTLFAMTSAGFSVFKPDSQPIACRYRFPWKASDKHSLPEAVHVLHDE